MEEQCIRVFEDNEGAVKLSGNPLGLARTKHSDVRHQFLLKLVYEGNILVLNVASEEQPADVLTRPRASRFSRSVEGFCWTHSCDKIMREG